MSNKRDYSNWSKDELVKELKKLEKRKKYGIVWEDKSEDVLTEKLIQFSEHKSKLNLNSPLIPWFAYQRAKKGIEREEADYKVDKVEPLNSKVRR